MVLKIKKRRANTKIGATLLFFGLCTRHDISATVEAHGHLLSSDTFFRALHFEPGRSPYNFFFDKFPQYRHPSLWQHFFIISQRQLSIRYFCSIIRMRVRKIERKELPSSSVHLYYFHIHVPGNLNLRVLACPLKKHSTQ